MYNLILQIAIFASLGAIIYITARALPRIEDSADVSQNQLPLIDSVFSSGFLDKADNLAKAILEKILRRMKIAVMKLDNFVSERLGKIKK